MASSITERVITESDLVIDNSTNAALSYYDRANDLIKRTHVAMGRTIKIQTTTIASTINANVITTSHASTR
ncbi:hypothetical protein KXD93_16610 [Mucilaginibacter sp. BJC16-A38]|uniref:hypothetical protein n=1 Tax=Mucilaginibacter phenanthrenivorans TaxID=1234842 RepID=UPI002157C7B2|nr:hypothetical protein [Mucilaginibacter phenanthrenivorans]MCR8559281.1 hypothetical protein [Mucilaginibacter phenanthrenivorans]